MLRKKKENGEKGFTIIEVVLVLAIAGLIFLVVFLALPALQRNQRDTQRKNDAGRFASQINNYQSNNKGTLPTPGTAGNIASFLANYMRSANDEFSDPQGGDYVATATAATGPTNTTDGAFIYETGTACDSTVTGDRAWHAKFQLEGGGEYCVGS
jgi:prepilin-type N-terminal cleavage/methylation domain-containing protein